MDVYTHNGQKYININGKDYFLIRGYKQDYSKFIFVQVTGNTPLHKEDMPTKNWEVIRTKSGSERVWTAYQKSLFAYKSTRENLKLAFIGASTEGSYFLALKVMAKRYNLSIGDKSLYSLACRYASREFSAHHLTSREDEGNSGVRMALIDIPSYVDKESVIAMFKGEE
jgi:hypothetical protein